MKRIDGKEYPFSNSKLCKECYLLGDQSICVKCRYGSNTGFTYIHEQKQDMFKHHLEIDLIAMKFHKERDR